MIVISPKNAFLAWQEDGFEELLDKDSTLRKEELTELKGGYDQILHTLNSGKRNFIINYEKLVNVTNLIGQFVLNPQNKVHIVLDESHKIKSEHSQRTEHHKLCQHFHLLKRYIVRTPMPNKAEDIKPQYKFLYPYSDYNNNRFLLELLKMN